MNRRAGLRHSTRSLAPQPFSNRSSPGGEIVGGWAAVDRLPRDLVGPRPCRYNMLRQEQSPWRAVIHHFSRHRRGRHGRERTLTRRPHARHEGLQVFDRVGVEIAICRRGVPCRQRPCDAVDAPVESRQVRALSSTSPPLSVQPWLRAMRIGIEQSGNSSCVASHPSASGRCVLIAGLLLGLDLSTDRRFFQRRSRLDVGDRRPGHVLGRLGRSAARQSPSQKR